MARVPGPTEYGRVSPRVTSDPGLRVPRGAFGSGISDVGDSLMARGGLLDTLSQRQKEDQRIVDANAETQARLEHNRELADELRRLETEPSDGGEIDYAAKMDEFSQKKRDAVLSKLPGRISATTRASISNRLLEIGAAYREKAADTGRRAALSTANDLVDQSIRESASSVRLDPNTLDIALGSIDETLAQYKGVFTENNLRDTRVGFRQALIESAVTAKMEAGDTKGARELLQGREVDGKRVGGLGAELDLKSQNSLALSIAREEKRIQAEAQAKLKSDVTLKLKDEIASIRDRGTGVGLKEAEIRAAYPETADRIIKELGTEKEFFGARKAVELNTPEEDMALLQKATPEGEGYASEVERRDLLIKAIQDKNKALADDPVSYVVKASPTLRAAFAQAVDDPAKLSQAVALSDEVQASLGVPDYARRVTTKAQADSLVANLTQTPAEDAADTLNGMAEQYGDNWSRVYGELVKSKLPSEYRILATVDNPVARKALGEALKTERAQKGSLRKGVGDEAKDIDDQITEELSEFRSTLAYAPDGSMISGDMEEAAKLLAYRYRSTMSASEASRRAVDDLVGKYTFVQDSNHNARVPREFVREAEDTADRLLKELTADQMPDPGGSPNISEQRRREIMLSAAKRGIWVTNESDDGWLLLDVNQQPVIRDDGSRVEFRFGEARRTVGDDRIRQDVIINRMNEPVR